MTHTPRAAHAPGMPKTETRGRPVWTLVLMIAGWVMLRAATWQPGLPDQAHKPDVVAHRSDAPTVVRASADAEQVELLELNAKSIRVSEYLTELPPLPLLRARLHQAIEHARAQAARRLPGSGEQP